ncbi:MAG TPA: hypothetical protein VHS26_05490 [Solirubrobacteraceae bacterium]|nr:hypothetical protein [Solirubrobacteraceae bacterium]
MATRTIVTSQPDVACDVCARRLLRGEQPDVFVGAGRRRIVCELCAPRAAHEGWLRETDTQSLTLAPMRSRRGRSLFERLRQVARPPGEARNPPIAGASDDPGAQSYDPFSDARESDPAPGHAQPSGSSASPAPAPEEAAEPVAQAVAPNAAAATETQAGVEQPSSYVREAIAVFNASEFPRRVAGVARSLGAPTVTVRSAEHLSSVVSIVVAWELCWYRYEVDLSEPGAEAQAIAQGTELGELDREDRLANAAAAESGALLLASV